MQVSLTESFNIVCADSVSSGISVVVSKDIKWIHPNFKADPNDINDIVNKLNFVYNNSDLSYKNKKRLNKYNIDGLKLWKEFLSNKC